MLIIKIGELQNISHMSFWVPIFAAAKDPFHKKLGPNGDPISKFVFLSLQEYPKVSSFFSATLDCSYLQL